MTKKEVLDWLYRIKSKLTMYFPVKWVSECEQAIDYAIKALENQKTGHWKKYNDKGLWECSECGELIYSETEQDRKEKHKFCSMCGAKMEGE